MNALPTALLSTERIEVPAFCQRPPSKVQDDLLRKSIAAGGIQQPLIVVRDGERYVLAKGLRRLRAARSLEIGKVPVVIDQAPDGESAESHARRLRFILVHNRQDLLPSQRGELVWTLKARFGMSNPDVAAYLGIAADSVTNWLAVRQYIPPVVKAMDAGALSMNAARAFDGMTEEGQRHLWKSHQDDILQLSADESHRKLRDTYPPDLFPRFYRQPELVGARLARTSGKRKAKPRSAFSPIEKKRLLASYEMRETELRSSKETLQRYEREINASIAPIAAIIRNPDLWKLVPDEMKEEFERFAEVYV